MKILWWRILLAGIVAEVLYFVFLMTVLGDVALAVSVPGFVGVFVLMLIGGLWIGRSAQSHFALQGGLVGVAGILFYTALTITVTLIGPENLGIDTESSASLSVALIVANHLTKIVGGSVGGYIGGALLRNEERIAG